MKIDDIMKKQKYSFYTPDEYGRDFFRIPTGVFSLDTIIGGGLPVAASSSLYGPPGGGKTTISSKALASAQQICWNCFEYLWDCKCDNKTPKKSVIVSTERCDLDWMESLGVDVNELVVAEPCSGEEAVDIIYEVMQADDCGLVLLDSLSRVIPESEIADPALSYQVGQRAKLHTKLMNKVKSTLIRQKKKGVHTAFLAINQIRASIGNFYGPSEEITGGFASKHDWHLTCRMSQLKTDKKYINKETEMPTYAKFKGSIISPGIKRKLFTLGGTCEFYVAMEDTAKHKKGAIYDEQVLSRYMKEYNLTKNGHTFKYIPDIKLKNQEEFLIKCREDDQYFRSAKKKMIDHLKEVKKGNIEPPPKKEKGAEENEA